MSSWFSFPHSDPSEVGDHVVSSVLSKGQWLAGNHPSQRRTYTLPTYQRQPPNTQQLHSISANYLHHYTDSSPALDVLGIVKL
ncbi:uncharacterized protein QC763_0106440 [Podospora pseudopauciseta]|uniref:Uncharacterized protein n=1 Tax=Podospora pseudopauciseta TaxID=2093780 RepID=A0ABR0H172_9PEZI|nr:hypothetical protein QC763_0106440 [Podospora pseudopauciseta]